MNLFMLSSTDIFLSGFLEIIQDKNPLGGETARGRDNKSIYLVYSSAFIVPSFLM